MPVRRIIYFRKPQATLQEKPRREPTIWVTLPLSILSLLAPLAYLLSYYFEGGYLNAYGIEQNLFIRAPQDYIAYSFTALAYIFGLVAPILETENYKSWLYVSLVAIVYFAFVIIFLRYLERASKNKPQLSGKFFKHLKNKTIITLLLSALALPLVPGIFIYTLLFLILPAMIAHNSGTKVAYKEIDAFHECKEDTKSHFNKCASVYENEKLVAHGVIVMSSEKYLAIYNGENTMLLPLNSETSVKIERQRTK